MPRELASASQVSARQVVTADIATDARRSQRDTRAKLVDAKAAKRSARAAPRGAGASRSTVRGSPSR